MSDAGMTAVIAIPAYETAAAKSKIFPSVLKCAEWFSTTSGRIKTHIKNGKEYAGYFFDEAIEQGEKND